MKSKKPNFKVKIPDLVYVDEGGPSFSIYILIPIVIIILGMLFIDIR